MKKKRKWNRYAILLDPKEHRVTIWINGAMVFQGDFFDKKRSHVFRATEELVGYGVTALVRHQATYEEILTAQQCVDLTSKKAKRVVGVRKLKPKKRRQRMHLLEVNPRSRMVGYPRAVHA